MRNISDEDLLAADTQRMGQLLMELGRLAPLRDPIASACEEFHLTPPQIHAVMWLGLDGTLTMGELAQRLRSTEKTVTGLVDRLERLGLAKRSRDEDDRRVVHVCLCRKGGTAHQKLFAVMRARLARFMAMLEPGERKVLLRILEKTVAQLGADAPLTVTKEAP